jgi:putative oxidoreductase
MLILPPAEMPGEPSLGKEGMSRAGRKGQAMATRMQGIAGWGDAWLLLFSRAAIATLFVADAVLKLGDMGGFAKSLAAKSVPYPSPVARLAWLALVLGGVGLLLGYRTRWAALLLIVFTIVATTLSHRFWQVPPAAFANQFAHFTKNLAIIGGLALIYRGGPGPLSLDRGG